MNGLHVISLQLQRWLDYNEEDLKCCGVPINDDLNVMLPPTWPTRGQLKAWITLLERNSNMSYVKPFTRMDQSTSEQWKFIGEQHELHDYRVADSIISLLKSLGNIKDGFAVDQLTHCLQIASLAENAGADEEVVIAALCHDIGKAISIANHPAIAAEILKPYVRNDVYEMIRVHQDFQGKHYYSHFGGDTDAREKHRWAMSVEQFQLAEKFADEWDQIAFDPEYPTPKLDHFEPLIRKIFVYKSAVPVKTSSKDSLSQGNIADSKYFIYSVIKSD